MKSVFICAMADTLSAASVDIRNGDRLFGPLEFHSYLPPTNHPLPFVPAYLQDYYLQPKLLKSFLRSDACKCPKMSLLEIVRAKDGKLVKKAKQYRYLCHHRVDFAICSARGELLMVFMLTGADGVADESRLRAEEIQQLLKIVGVPVTKIELKSKYSASALHNILSQL